MTKIRRNVGMRIRMKPDGRRGGNAGDRMLEKGKRPIFDPFEGLAVLVAQRRRSCFTCYLMKLSADK